MKDNLLALLAQLDCGNRSCYFANNKSGQRTNGGCDCLKELPLKLRAALVKFWRDEICTFDCEGGVTTSTREVINWKLRAHLSTPKKRYQYFVGAVDGLEVEMEFVDITGDVPTITFWLDGEKYLTEAELIAAVRRPDNNGEESTEG